MNYPTYVIIDGKRYDINTDFRIALKCEKIAEDETIYDEERALAIIYLLFGDEGLNSNNKNELLEKAKTYLSCGKEIKSSNEKPDMDYEEDWDYVEASFMSDYRIDLSEVKMHWWKFNKLMNGLSNSEMGNCCVLNRIRNLRTYDLKKIDDPKEKQRIKKAQEEVALKKYKPKKKVATEEQRKNAMDFLKSLNKEVI